MKKSQFFLKMILTNSFLFVIIISLRAGVAQLVEQLICNQQVGGSSPSTSSNMGEFPSGQRGQTVNLLLNASVVRIHLPPPKKRLATASRFFIQADRLGM